MPAKQTYLIRRLADGTQRTVQAFSGRGAMQVFVAGYGPPVGEDFAVKVRGEDGWEHFRVTSGGIRKLAG